MRISRFLWKKPSWAYIHVDVSCVMRSSDEESFCLYEFSDLLVIWWIVPDINFKDIVEGTIYEPIIILFVWMLNASVYLLNWCWREFQSFCGTNHQPIIILMTIMINLLMTFIDIRHEFEGFHGSSRYWAYDPVDTCCMMSLLKQGSFCLFECWIPLFI